MSKDEPHAIGRIGFPDAIQASGNRTLFLIILIAANPLIVCLFLFSILAPTMYIFFASALPVIAFGEQLSKETGRQDFPWSKYTRSRSKVQVDIELTCCRWSSEHGWNLSLHSYLRHPALDTWWAADVNRRSRGADCNHVHVSLQFRQRAWRSGSASLLGLGRMVSDGYFIRICV